MEYVVYLVALLIIGFSAYQIYMIRKSGNITEQGWSTIRELGYSTIQSLMQLYSVKTDKEQFIAFTVTTIREKIVESANLTEIDKNFWTEERLTAIFRPVINGLIEKAEELQNK